MSSEPDARALRRMVHELQGDATPDLDWERVESRLFGELGVAEPSGMGTPVGTSIMPESGSSVAAAPRSPERAGPAVVPVAADLAASAGAALLVADVDGDDEPVPVSRVPGSLLPGGGIPAHAARDSLIDLRDVRGSEGGRFSRGALGFVAAFAVAAGVLVGFGLGGDRAGRAVAQRDPIDSDALPLAGYSTSEVHSPRGNDLQAPGAATDQPVRDLGSLKQGDVVEASSGPLSFGERGVLTWTLLPGGRVSVLSDGGASQVVLSLDSGSLSAEVSGDRGLVVRAGGGEVETTRGVIFSVTRSSRGLFVQVDQGAASVGAEGGVGERHLVEAPHRGKLASDGFSFELVPAPVAARVVVDGSRVASTEPAPAPAPKPGDVAVLDERPTRSPVPTAASALAASGPSAQAPAPLGEAAIRSRLMRCLVDARAAARSKSPDGVTVTVSSTLRIKVDDAGAVKAASFSPPLLPELQSCAVFLFQERLEPGARSVSIPVDLAD